MGDDLSAAAVGRPTAAEGGGGGDGTYLFEPRDGGPELYRHRNSLVQEPSLHGVEDVHGERPRADGYGDDHREEGDELAHPEPDLPASIFPLHPELPHRLGVIIPSHPKELDELALVGIPHVLGQASVLRDPQQLRARRVHHGRRGPQELRRRPRRRVPSLVLHRSPTELPRRSKEGGIRILLHKTVLYRATHYQPKCGAEVWGGRMD